MKGCPLCLRTEYRGTFSKFTFTGKPNSFSSVEELKTMKRSILLIVVVLALIGHNMHRIYSNYEYDGMAIFVQVSMIVSFTLIAIEAWVNEKRDNKS
ncbi:MAG: hypothetical protein RIG77_01335 [Cyclobacteriaceae bacterium]